MLFRFSCTLLISQYADSFKLGVDRQSVELQSSSFDLEAIESLLHDGRIVIGEAI
jgi:hypothetical protein